MKKRKKTDENRKNDIFENQQEFWNVIYYTMPKVTGFHRLPKLNSVS